MGTFDSFADAPGQIKTEGETITLTFSPGLPVSGQGTVSWNIPTPAHGCVAAADGRGAYCGMLVLLSTSPLVAANIPADGTFYTNDPTASPDLHVGDKIGDALVVGAFYEGELRSRGEALSTTLIVHNLIPNTPYYVAGYAVDCQGRYHSDGVRGYSSEYGKQDQPDSPANQIVLMNDGSGVLPTDGTNLIPGVEYAFDVEVNENFPTAGTPADIINVVINGDDAQTYEELIAAVNTQLSLAENPPQSPVPPNTGSYFVNATAPQLSLFNGTTYDPIAALFEPTDPTAIVAGDYWVDDNGLLQIWDTPIVGAWNPTTVISYLADPTQPGCDEYWWNGTQAYKHNGAAWCEVPSTSAATNPAVVLPFDCGTWWFDGTNSAMFEWDPKTASWTATQAIYWDVAPNALVAGTYWYDLTDSVLSVRDITATGWDLVTTVLTQDTAPVPPLAPGQLWFNPTTEELFSWNGGTLTFDAVPVLVWAGDPTITESCDMWWDSINDLLFTWDVVNSTWDQVPSFIQALTDPTIPPVFAIGALWFNTTDQTLYLYDGSDFVLQAFINHPTDPSVPTLGDAWFNTTTGVYSIWNTPVAGWNEIDPVNSATDPTTIAPGTFWYDSTLNVLNQRVGATWVPVPYTTKPITPVKGAQWFDTLTNTLKAWNGSSWIPTPPKLQIGLTSAGDLVFQSRAAGSCVSVLTIVPGTAPSQISTGFADFHSYGHGTFTENTFIAPPVPKTNVSETAFLFNNLPSRVLGPTYGVDGLPGQPMYNIIGVGDDGTPDERRELADSIRAQLGYPVVEVELTPYQIDTAITGAIESLRKRSDIAYKRGYFFLDVIPGIQQYRLTNKKAGFHKIVTVTAVNRFSSAFLGAAGNSVFEQAFVQNLYQAGTHDLTTFHLTAQYIETLEDILATRIVFNWNEDSRVLHMHQSFRHHERVLLDCSVERTEQDLFKDRWVKTWIEKYALAQSRYILAEIRGKFASLPGAGGGVSLNAADLQTRADQDMQDLYQQLDDMVASRVEEWGMGSAFVFG